MKAEELCLVLGDIDEAYIRQAHAPRKRPAAWYALAAAACLAVVITAGVFFLQPFNMLDKSAAEIPAAAPEADMPAVDTPAAEYYFRDEEDSIQLHVNRVDSLATADMDVAGFAEWPGSVSCTAEEAFAQTLGIGYDAFIAKLPDDWTVSLSVLTAPDYDTETKEKTYEPHDFILRCTTSSGGKIRIALCAGEKPLRDVYFAVGSSVISEVYGMPVEVYGFQDWFYAYCNNGALFYDIETKNIPLEDLEALLRNLLQ